MRGDVLHGPIGANDLTVVVVLVLALLMYPANYVVILTNDTVLDVVRLASKGGCPLLVDVFPVLRVDAREESIIGHGRSPGNAEDAVGLVGP